MNFRSCCLEAPILDQVEKQKELVGIPTSSFSDNV